MGLPFGFLDFCLHAFRPLGGGRHKNAREAAWQLFFFGGGAFRFRDFGAYARGRREARACAGLPLGPGKLFARVPPFRRRGAQTYVGLPSGFRFFVCARAALWAFGWRETQTCVELPLGLVRVPPCGPAGNPNVRGIALGPGGPGTGPRARRPRGRREFKTYVQMPFEEPGIPLTRGTALLFFSF